MKTIWKAVLEITDKQTLSVPKGAKFLSVANQNEKLCAWFLVEGDTDFELALETKTICIFGTGGPIPDKFKGEFIGTVLMYDGALAWHVFEEL